MNKIDKFKEKIDKLKENKKESFQKNKKNDSLNYNIALNISIELITGIGLGVFFGIMLDNYLQTKPLMLIICFIFGTLVGFYNMYKTLKRYNYFK